MTPTPSPTPTGRRLLPLRAAALAGAAVLPLAVFAAPAHAAPGDNGDVKIHIVGTLSDAHQNQPKVCTFYLDAFDFDTVQQVTWHIDQQPPTGNAQVDAGQLTLTGGTGQTGTRSLPTGHYQLTWNFAGETGDGKHKTFMVDCPDLGSPPPSGSPSPVGNDGGGGSPSPSSSSSPSTPPGGPGQGGGPGRRPQGGVAAGAGGSSRDLNPAEVTVGAALVAGAGYLVVRRRRRSRR
ncbi:hypothetical protein [Kitasatospora phosalacinea]|uniref:Gram-positive cocci surface proteins LPxTG domain-containing protein n=1 Tax=Kitasatospora phosalacinea TaxID=2065 RepID=A0A9W6URR3_9ACTN|nr:hypothetical protein [Kitasatospora phosalacinea]GLW58619.1 hypothetical protein Kpho01_66300 [Kitasatospora phosalacinea]